MDDRTYKIVLVSIVFLFGLTASFILFQLFQSAPDQEEGEATTASKKTAEKQSKQPSEKKSSEPEVTVWDARPDSDLTLQERIEDIKSRGNENDPTKQPRISNHTMAFVRAGTKAVPLLKKAATHSQPRIRAWATHTIGELFSTGKEINHPEDQPSFETVRELLEKRAKNDSSRSVREEAILALGKIGTNEARRVLNSLEQSLENQYLRERLEFARQLMD